MALKHYYVEDINVDPRREDRISPVQSIQFDSLDNGKVWVNVWQPNGKKVIKASVIIPIEELKNAYDWLKE